MSAKLPMEIGELISLQWGDISAAGNALLIG
jgi:hypothetical protein